MFICGPKLCVSPGFSKTNAETEKFEALMSFFKKYADMYGFDWHKIAALAYQESGFEQNTRSRAGAVGVMQIKPTTAADPRIGISDVETNVEKNIHAGVKYLAFIRDRYFNDPEVSSADSVDFTFAAYNAGPARINSLRREAKDLNLDPDKWFLNVEYVARREIGQETVQYVSNIYKYYIAHKSIEKSLEEKTLIKQKTIQ